MESQYTSLSDYMVVVYCATYNQHEFITDTLRGIISQKVDFPFCAVIIDDCSDDHQQEIILDFARQYPNIIKPVLLEFNHYQRGISRNGYLRPWIEHSKYVAHCEGDDYWTDPNKLQTQVDFMERHPECSLTYHSCHNLFVEGYNGNSVLFGETVKEEYSYLDILRGYPFQTSTILYRSSIWLSDFTTKSLNIMNYSSVLFLCASLQGHLMGVNRQMSVYRRNNQGISNDIHKRGKALILFNGWRAIAEMCNGEVSKAIHSIMVSAQLYSLYKVDKKQFILSCKEELLSNPTVVFSVFRRILFSWIVGIIK